MKVTLCVITKNEAEYIARCINSVSSIVDEMIVVDTGSTDDTVKIAEKLGAKTYQFEWVNDFSKARNYALSKAKGDWIIFLDADEFVTSETLNKIIPSIKVAMKEKADGILGFILNYEKEGYKLLDSFKNVRIFRKDANIRYSGSIHEHLIHTKRQLKFIDASDRIHIGHTGYSKEDKIKKKKGERNLRLLFEQLKNNPSDGMTHYYIAEALALDKKYVDAIKHCDAALRSTNLPSSIRAKNHKNKISYMLILNKPIKRVIDSLKEAIKEFPDYPDLHYLLGNIYEVNGRKFDAISCYEQALHMVRYANKYQTSIMKNIDRMNKSLTSLYMHTEQYHKSVQKNVELLKADRYDIESLKNLMTILLTFENVQDIIDFLKKIYDFSEAKDVLTLLQASFFIGSYDLSSAIFSLFNEAQQSRLQFEKAYIEFLNYQFQNCLDNFYRLYLKTKDKETAVYCIVCARLTRNRNALINLTDNLDPSMQRAIKVLYLNEAEQLEELEYRELFNLAVQYIKLSCTAEASEVLNILPAHYWLQAAEHAFSYRQYEYSLDIYNRYLESHNDKVPTSNLFYTLYRMGECLYRLGQYELSTAFFKDAIHVSPEQYRSYEMAIMASEKIGDLTALKEFLLQGLSRFPDSEFLQSKKVLFPDVQFDPFTVHNHQQSHADKINAGIMEQPAVHKRNQIKHILYLGWLGQGNVGDDVLFELFKHMVYRYHDPSEFTINIDSLPMIKGYRVDFSHYDLVVIGGGSLLHSEYYLKMALFAIENNIPVVSWGTGIDGYYKGNNEEIVSISKHLSRYNNIYHKLKFISVRGPYTKIIMENTGADSEIHEVGDPALIYSDEVVSSETKKEKLNKNILINWGTSYNNIFGGKEEDVENELVKVIHRLISNGYNVTVYPIWTKDIESVMRLNKKVNHRACRVISEVYEAKALQKLINESYMTINLKLHANILSASGNVPFISLAYRGKCFDFARSVDCSEFAVATDEITAEKILKLVSDIHENYADIVERFKRAKENYHPKLIHSIHVITHLLKGNQKSNLDKDNELTKKLDDLIDRIESLKGKESDLE